MLDNVFWGNTVKDWGISLIIIVCTILFTKLLAIFNQKVVKKITLKTRNKIDDLVFDTVEAPIKFGVLLLGIWIALHRLHFSPKLTTGIEDSYRILVVLNITWFFVRTFTSLLDVYWNKKRDDSSRTERHTNRMMPIVKRIVVILVWLIGIVTALSNVGVNISALLGTLGIGGIAFALAAQDTIKNIFGAFTIFTDRPFSIGDTIRIDNFEGTIIDVGIRSTKMRNTDKRLISIPNSKLTDASIINISAEPMRRVVAKLGLTYETTPEKMSEAIKLLQSIPSKVKFVSPKDLTANFTDFADSALIITFTYFIEKRGDIGNTTSEVNMAILNDFNKAGLSFAFPTQTVYIDRGEEMGVKN